MLVFIGLLTTALGPTFGQVSARQGTAPPPKLLAAYAAEPRPTIELTLTVRDDS